jgi:hypothetical protein
MAMQEYLKTLLKKFSWFTESINETTVYTEKLWLQEADKAAQITYFFYNTGRLTITDNGQTKEGYWITDDEKEMLILEIGEERKVLKPVYVSKNILILKKPRSPKPPIVLYNPQVVKDLTVQQYLERSIMRKMHRRDKVGDVIWIGEDGKRRREKDREV